MPGTAAAILRNFGVDAPGHRAVGLGAALVLAAGGVVLSAESAQAAQQEEQYVVNGSYSDDGNTQSLTVRRFDPALGTLTQVEVYLDFTTHLEVCFFNGSDVPSTLPVTAALPTITVDLPQVTAAGSNTYPVGHTPQFSIPATTLNAAPGGQSPCELWEASGNQDNWVPGGADLTAKWYPFVSTLDDPQTFTAPAVLAAVTGAGTVSVNLAASWASDYNTNAPPGWTAEANLWGEVTATVTYTYDDAGGAQDPPADNPPAQDAPAQNPPAQASGPGPRVNTGGSLMADRRSVAVGTVFVGTGLVLAAGIRIVGSIRRERKSLR
jgi:hypothetical protein